MLALLFPGQGAQSAGFLHRLSSHPVVDATFEEASDALSLDVLSLDSADALRSSVAVQITMVVAGVATTRRLAAAGIECELTAGLSVGAYAAAVTSGALAFADALRMVRRRGELMEGAYPSGYGMSAIEGLTEHQIEMLVGVASADTASSVYIGNVNAPRQIVVAGSDAALESFNARALAAGAQRAIRLVMSVPSHCELLATASEELLAYAADVPFHAPRCTYVGNRGARALRTADAIRNDLATNMRYTVRWFDALTAIIEHGATLLVEAPPGQVLTQIARTAYPEVSALAASALTDEHLAETIRRRLQVAK